MIIGLPTYLIDYRSRICFAGGGDSGGGGYSPGPTQTTVQKSDPWSGQQPYLTTGFARAQSDVLNRKPEYFPGSTVIPYSPETLYAMNLTSQRALAGSPVTRASTDELSKTLAGNYLYGNPGFDAAVAAAMHKAQPGIDSQFELSGRYGSGLHQTAKNQAFADAFASENNNERTRQMQAMMFAPQVAASDYNDYSMLGAVGAQKEALSQEQLADEIARWDYEQMSPTKQLQEYMNLIQGNYGGTSTITSPGPGTYRNRGGSFLGGALGGAQIGAMIPGLGWGGAVGGGLLGGLLGAFS